MWVKMLKLCFLILALIAQGRVTGKASEMCGNAIALVTFSWHCVVVELLTVQYKANFSVSDCSSQDDEGPYRGKLIGKLNSYHHQVQFLRSLIYWN